MDSAVCSNPEDERKLPTLGMDWESDPSTLPNHIKFMRSVDWKSSEIGLPEQWPEQLHHCVDFVLADPTPASIMWGHDLTVRSSSLSVSSSTCSFHSLIPSTIILLTATDDIQ
jgi:hypothetical protein